jgi:hypothetical protein
MIPLNNTSGMFLAALRRAERRREPFDYWLLEDILPAGVCDGIAGLPFSPPDNAIFDGRREANNTKRVRRRFCRHGMREDGHEQWRT